MQLKDIFEQISVTARSVIREKLTIDRLIAMDDGEVRKQMGTLFTRQLRSSSTVRDTFFPHAPAPEQAADQSWVDDVAVALVAWSLALTSQHGFSGTADQERARAVVAVNLDPDFPDFVALAAVNYGHLFPTFAAADGVPFAAYQRSDAETWGQRLADTMTSQEYIDKEMAGFAADPQGFLQRLFCNIFKVKLLRPDLKDRVADRWDELLRGQVKNARWNVYQYMLAANYTAQTFLVDVQNAVNQRTVTRFRPVIGISHIVMSIPSEYTYGVQVANWLQQHASCYVLTGAAPNNVEKARSGGHCFMPGSPVLLADGSIKPIDAVDEGDEVHGRAGTVERRSAQKVTWPLAGDECLYSVNDYPPFFTASHPFLTPEGWKAVSPEAARRLNPGVEINELRVGDRLLQVVSTDPFRYREVAVSEISEWAAGEQRNVHSLHLHREKQAYHVYGFCVAVNYPELTEDHVVKALSQLTAAERRLITEHMRPVLPLLTAVLGDFVGHVLISGLLGAGAVSAQSGGAGRVGAGHDHVG